MKDITQALTAAIPGFAIPAGARAVLIADNGNGTFDMKAVPHGKSVLDVRTELFDHINAYPHSDEWLQDLRDYCDTRLAARAEARGTRGLAIPRGERKWEIVHGPAFQAVSLAS